MRLVVDIAFGVVVSTLVMVLGWHWFGARGLVCTAPVLCLLAPSLVELYTGLPRVAHQLALREIEGRYFEFRGRSMGIHIDDDARCWVSTADVRKVAALPVDAVLSRMAPLDCRQLGEPLQWRITSEALTQLLAKSSDPEVAKFCRWLEVDVARPARNRRDGRRIPD